MKENMANTHYTQEDEIDLRELWQVILRGKKLIILVTTIIVVLATIYTMAKPNEYTSKTVLVSQEGSSSTNFHMHVDLADLAAINMLLNDQINPTHAYQSLLDNDSFMKDFVVSRGLHKRFLSPNLVNNYKFALDFNLSGIYTIFNSSSNHNFDDMSSNEKEMAIYKVVEKIRDIINISVDKKTNLLTVSATFYDRELARDLVDYFLKDASLYLKKIDMLENDQKIKYCEEASQNTQDVALKTKLAKLSSALKQKKVLANASEYYNVKQLVKPEAGEKSGPKRALIVVVSAVTGLILSIFLVFLLEFIRKEDKNQAE